MMMTSSHKSPTFKGLDDEVFLLGKARIGESFTRLTAAVTQVFVQPETKVSVSRSDYQTVLISLNEVHVISRPGKASKVRIECEQKWFSRPIEQVTCFKWTRGEGTENWSSNIFNYHQDWRFTLSHFTVQGMERESMFGRRVKQLPGVTFSSSR